MDEPDDDTPQDDETQVMALSGTLQLQFLAILNTEGWANCPHVAAHACASLLAQVLRAVVLRDPQKLQWTLTLVDQVRAFVIDNTSVTPGSTRH